MTNKDDIIIYQAVNGAIELRGDIRTETMCANIDQIAILFGRDKLVISRHLSKIFSEEELGRDWTVAKNATVQKEGWRMVTREIDYYNLDVIISVGYRVNPKAATKFRQWATKTLKSHIVDGYTIHPTRIEKHYEQFLKAVEDVKKILPANTGFEANETLELIKIFAGTWFSLDAYDKSSLPTSGVSKKQVEFTAEELVQALMELKADLIEKGSHPSVRRRKTDWKSRGNCRKHFPVGIRIRCLSYARRKSSASALFYY